MHARSELPFARAERPWMKSNRNSQTVSVQTAGFTLFCLGFSGASMLLPSIGKNHSYTERLRSVFFFFDIFLGGIIGRRHRWVTVFLWVSGWATSCFCDFFCFLLSESSRLCNGFLPFFSEIVEGYLLPCFASCADRESRYG